MASGPAVEQTGEWYQQMFALIMVVFFASLGGMIVQAITYGFRLKSGKIDWGMGQLSEKVQVPPLVGMIICGCLARNYLCEGYMQHYPVALASWIRLVCLSIILLRGGLELDFAGKGLTMVLLTLFPQIFEATAAAIATNLILGYPWAICFAHGFTLGAVSPAVVVPSMMVLHKNGYGTDKGIPTTTIAASSFDDIIAITAFGVFLTIGFNEAPGGVASEENGGDSVGFEVFMNIVQLAAGFIFGMGLGWGIGKPIHKIESEKCRKWSKLLFVMIVAIAMPFLAEVTTFVESKFVGIIFFGYMCFVQWGEEKPEHALGQIWMFCQPLLFGTVGAAVLFTKINASELGTGIIIILIGLTFRWIGAYLAFCEKKYTKKEAAFVAFAWIPKATVQAALGGMTLAETNKRIGQCATDYEYCVNEATEAGEDPALECTECDAEKLAEYEAMGTAMLTMAVFAIVITAPAGAIFINTLGPMWLNKTDPDEEAVFDASKAQTLRTAADVVEGLKKGEEKDQAEIDVKKAALEEKKARRLRNEERRKKKQAKMEKSAAADGAAKPEYKWPAANSDVSESDCPDEGEA